MITINNKEYRNIQEQVEKNKQDIEFIINEEGTLNKFGLKVTHEEVPVTELPEGHYGDFCVLYDDGVYTPYTCNDDDIWSSSIDVYKEVFNDWKYGDTIAVLCDDDPVQHYLLTLTRKNENHIKDYWFNIGTFPLAGPQGPEGPAGTYTAGTGITIASNTISVDTATIATKASVDSKLDKVTSVSSGSQVYAKNSSGAQQMAYYSSGVVANAIVSRDGNGNITLPDKQYITGTNHAASKGYVSDNFVPKFTATVGYFIYARGNGDEVRLPYNTAVTSWCVPQRDANGNIYLPDSQYITGNNYAASKVYVDTNKGTKLYKHTFTDSVSGLTYNFITNGSTAVVYDEMYSAFDFGFQQIISIIVNDVNDGSAKNCWFRDPGMHSPSTVYVDALYYINNGSIDTFDLSSDMTDTVTTL